MADSEEKLRADARTNRDRILRVAREALTADPTASLNSIGKMAGIGAGTLYRHFPSREALVLGVYHSELAALAEIVPTLLEEHKPLQAFRMWCDRVAEFGRLKHGVANLLPVANSDLETRKTYAPIIEAVRKLIKACESSGEIDAGADAEDFLLLLGLLWRVPPTPEGVIRVKRLLALAFRGLGAAD